MDAARIEAVCGRCEHSTNLSVSFDAVEIWGRSRTPAIHPLLFAQIFINSY